MRDILNIPRDLDLSAAPVSAAASGPTVTQEAEDEMDAELQKLRYHIHQAECVLARPRQPRSRNWKRKWPSLKTWEKNRGERWKRWEK